MLQMKSDTSYHQGFAAHPYGDVIITNDDDSTSVRIIMHNPVVGHNTYKVSVTGCNHAKYTVTRQGKGSGDDSWVGYTIQRTGIPHDPNNPWW